MASSSLWKSTIVRIRNEALRTFFRVAELLAPWAGGRVARDLWFTAPPRMPATELPEGGQPFEVGLEDITVRGHFWGNGPVVYLVHGWGGRGGQLAAYVEPLTAAGYRVVLFDFPSHGDSDEGVAGRRRTSGREFGRALDEVFARFAFEPAHAVIAHSMGTISTYLTLRHGWLRTSRLVLLAPMVEAESLLDGFQAALGFGPRTRRAFDREVDRFVGLPVKEFDARVLAGHVDPRPTLVIHDEGDPQTPYADAAAFAAALPETRFITTTGLGHRRILRDPAVVAEVLQFLRDEDSQTSVA